MLGDSLITKDVTNKVQEIVDKGEIDFPANRLGEGDDLSPLDQKLLKIDYTFNGKLNKVIIPDGENVCFDYFNIPQPTVKIKGLKIDI